MLKLQKLDQRGIMNPLTIPLILAMLIVIGLSVTAVMYYTKYIEQRDANKPIIAAAVAEAEASQKEQLEKEFTEREKVPTKNYTSPQQLGSVKLSFPKTWSSYVENARSGTLEFYAHPNFVPADGVNYALRMSIESVAFSDAVKDYDSQVEEGVLRAAAVRASGTTGTRLDGFLEDEKEGSMVIFPLRDKTLRVWTESSEFTPDFNEIILKALTFVP